MLSLPQVLGYNGLVVLFDETEAALRSTRPWSSLSRRQQAHLAHIRTFVDHIATGAFRGCAIYYAVTEEFIDIASRNLGALSQRLERTRLPELAGASNPHAIWVNIDELTDPDPRDPRFFADLSNRIINIGQGAKSPASQAAASPSSALNLTFGKILLFSVTNFPGGERTMNASKTMVMAFSALVLISCTGTSRGPADSSKAIPEGQPESTAATATAPETAAETATAEAEDPAQPTLSEIAYESVDGIDSYADIMEGKSFESITLTARLALPAQCSEPGQKVPAVIIQHGSGAPAHRWYQELSEALARAGIAALVPDSFTARRLGSTARDQTPLSKANRVYDAFAAFRTLAAMPCIDPDRIGVTGYSFGGIVSRDVVESAMAERLGAGRVFKASLPVYPSCQSQWDESRPTNTRVHFLLAERDDYTPASYCIEHVPHLEAAGWNVSYSVYRGAHHGFISDRRAGRDREAWTFKGCGITRVTKEGYEVTEKYGIDVGKTMTWGEYIRKAARACGKRGVTVGSDKKTRASAMQFTVEFFSENL